jgi:acetyl esterase/lipase
MLHEKIIFDKSKPHVFMMTYISENSPELRNTPKKVVLVLPGGGYQMTSDREAEPIAKAYFAAGFNTFVLRYSVQGEAVMYAPLIDALRAVKYIRDHAEQWNIDKDKIIVCGFSAGGHLAASAGTLWKLDVVRETLGCDSAYVRPNGMILGYPVITAGDKAHKDSILTLLAGRPSAATDSDYPTDAEFDLFSLEKHVDADTPPAFIWHTASDGLVPVENALYMCEALAEHNVPFELHIFPRGDHGLSLANDETAPNDSMEIPYVARWFDMSVKWVNESL